MKHSLYNIHININMSEKVQSIASLLQILAAKKMPQTELATQANLNYGQVNRFLNGHSDMYLSSFVELCEALDIDLIKIIRDRTKSATQMEDQKYETAEDCLIYFYKNLDKLGRQSYLNQLAWAARIVNKGNKKFPVQIEEVLKRETNLI
jgi:transcriptional regulator with XRE-family HTH domain